MTRYARKSPQQRAEFLTAAGVAAAASMTAAELGASYGIKGQEVHRRLHAWGRSDLSVILAANANRRVQTDRSQRMVARNARLRTERLADIETLLAGGTSPQDIARRLGVATATIERQAERYEHTDERWREIARVFRRSTWAARPEARA